MMRNLPAAIRHEFPLIDRLVWNSLLPEYKDNLNTAQRRYQQQINELKAKRQNLQRILVGETNPLRVARLNQSLQEVMFEKNKIAQEHANAMSQAKDYIQWYYELYSRKGSLLRHYLGEFMFSLDEDEIKDYIHENIANTYHYEPRNFVQIWAKKLHLAPPAQHAKSDKLIQSLNKKIDDVLYASLVPGEGQAFDSLELLVRSHVAERVGTRVKSRSLVGYSLEKIPSLLIEANQSLRLELLFARALEQFNPRQTDNFLNSYQSLSPKAKFQAIERVSEMVRDISALRSLYWRTALQDLLIKLFDLNSAAYAITDPLARAPWQNVLQQNIEIAQNGVVNALNRMRTGAIAGFAVFCTFLPFVAIQHIVLQASLSAGLALFKKGYHAGFTHIDDLMKASSDILNKPHAFIDRSFRMIVILVSMFIAASIISTLVSPLAIAVGLFRTPVMMASYYGIVVAGAHAHRIAQAISQKLARAVYGVANPDFYRPSPLMQRFLTPEVITQLRSTFFKRASMLEKRLDLAYDAYSISAQERHRIDQHDLHATEACWQALNTRPDVMPPPWKAFASQQLERNKRDLKLQTREDVTAIMDSATAKLLSLYQADIKAEQAPQQDKEVRLACVQICLNSMQDVSKSILTCYQSKATKPLFEEITEICQTDAVLNQLAQASQPQPLPNRQVPAQRG